jgi:hypothetical protein
VRYLPLNSISSCYEPLERGLAILTFVGLCFGFSITAAARTVSARSPSFADVSTAIAVASDGDTVLVPSGTASWGTGLVITKGIQLIGQTTTDSVAGTAVDRTIIQDNVARRAGGVPIIRVQSASGKAYRIGGFTFQTLSTSLNNNGAIILEGTSHSVRLDHCHFKPLTSQSTYVAVMGAIYGVADHNVLELFRAQSFFFNMGNWPNPDATAGQNGDGSWAAPTALGSEKFFFVEDNYLRNQSNFDEFGGNTDDLSGARWVFRHNQCYDIEMQSHGTESGRYRGGRVREIYENDFHNAHAHGAGGIRSGVTITHDNRYYGTAPTHNLALQAYRSFFRWPIQSSPWGGATGDNPWDLNDTQGNGSNVPGHNPFLYASGTATGGSKSAIVDSTKNWRADQWTGFTAKRVSDNQVAYIFGNTSNTLNVIYYTDSGGGAIWKTGDQYQIHKCLVVLDQPGRGQCDLIIATPPRNSKTGTAAWPHQALEPTYSWNDKYIPNGSSVKITGGRTLVENRDFYNDTPMLGYKPYTYPHPLVSGGGGPTPTPTPSGTPNPPSSLRVVPGS